MPLYAHYPNECIDRFLYGIPFTAIIAPFTIFPNFIGMTLWCMANALLLYFAISKLQLSRQKFAVVIWLCVNELFSGIIMQQYNIAIAGMVILSFALIERKKEFWAAFFIALSTITKVYGIVGLVLIPFAQRKDVLIKSIIFWFAVLFVLPMFYTSPQYVIEQYMQWGSTLLNKNSQNYFTTYTNISLLGMIRKCSGVTSYSDIWIIITGAVLFFAPLLRVGQYTSKQFRLHYLCSALLFYVLFSSGTENSGYIAAMVAAALWYISTPTGNTKSAINSTLIIFCFILTSLSPTDIFPSFIRKQYIVPYALKALPCTFIWLKIVWEQLSFDFINNTHSSSVVQFYNICKQKFAFMKFYI
ncbi:MAG: glycosyltransferase family 87 protein [Bacteroidales bacterium]